MSNIYFKRVAIKNFMSYENADITLNTPGYVFVNGVNTNPLDSAKSNGSGKSTLFNAIIWALTGQTTSGVKDIVNIYRKDGESYAEVEFECSGKSYLIRRSKNPSNLKIFIDGKDMSGKGIRDSEKLLLEYLPELTGSLLNSVIILGQGLPQRFTNNSPSGRKEVLESLSKSDFMIDDLKQRLSDRKEFLSNSLHDKELSYASNAGKIDLEYKSIFNLKAELLELGSKDELNKKIEDDKKRLQELETTKDRLSKTITELDIHIQELNNELISIDKKKSEDIDGIDSQRVKELSDAVDDVELKIRLTQGELTKLESIVDVCPTCGQKLPDVHKVDTTDIRKELSSLEKERDELQKQLDVESDAFLDAVDTVKKKYEDMSEDIKNNLHKSTTEKATTNKELEECMNEITPVVAFISKNVAELSILDTTENKLRSDIEACEASIESLEKENVVMTNEIDILKKHLDINSKMSTIVKRDFRGYLLTNVIDFISSKCKDYSLQVFGTEDISFKLDGNNISIAYDGKEYESLSGGEKQKIDVILQLSIRDMLCTYLNFSSNILVLDEITDAMDEIGAQKIFNLISNNLSDVETVYLISHHTDFEIPYDREIHIIKGDDKISRIVE